MTIHHLLLIGSCVCFGCKVAGVPARVSLTDLGLLLWCLTGLV